MCIYNFGHDRRWQTLYHATLEHFTTGRRFDRTARRAIEKNDGAIPDTQLLRDIAKEYKVIRGIPRADRDNDQAAECFRTALNKAAQNWQGDLVDKARKCLALASQASEQGWTHRRLISAMTKYMWFLRPQGWTVYDSFARRGLCIYDDDPDTAVVQFYQKLQDRGFLEAADAISATLPNQEMNWLFGERVIDKYLMIAGGAVESGLIPPVQEILDKLDAETAATADAIAQAVATEHCDKAFFLPPQD